MILWDGRIREGKAPIVFRFVLSEANCRTGNGKVSLFRYFLASKRVCKWCEINLVGKRKKIQALLRDVTCGQTFHRVYWKSSWLRCFYSRGWKPQVCLHWLLGHPKVLCHELVPNVDVALPSSEVVFGIFRNIALPLDASQEKSLNRFRTVADISRNYVVFSLRARRWNFNKAIFLLDVALNRARRSISHIY